MIREDLTGKKFGRLTVVSFSHMNKNHKSCYLCQCDCGKYVTVIGNNLKKGTSKSCGCLNIEKIIQRNTKHSCSRSRIYRIWQGIKKRTLCKTAKSYLNYGGRGIKIATEWLDFNKFYEWALSNGYKNNLTIDRINVNGDYSPENCRWSSYKEQGRNKRNNVLITFKGITKCRSEWEEELCFTKDLIRNRLRRGWSVEKALSEPLYKHKEI